jgi:cephalosporin hydroxylase
MPKLIEKQPEPSEQDENPLRRAGRFLRKHEMWLIRLQAIKDSYADPEAYEKAEHLEGTREFLEAGKLIIELISMISSIQAERLADLVDLMQNPDTAVEALLKSRGEEQ